MKVVSFEDIRKSIAGQEYLKLICVKDKPIYVKPAEIGQEIITFIQTPDGELVEECSGSSFSEGALIITQLMAVQGRTDRKTFKNQYIMHRGYEELNSKYDRGPEEKDSEVDGQIYYPKKGHIKEVFLVSENIQFPYPPSWGQEGLFTLYKGGVVVDNKPTTPLESFYGINMVEFCSTHTVIPS